MADFGPSNSKRSDEFGGLRLPARPEWSAVRRAISNKLDEEVPSGPESFGAGFEALTAATAEVAHPIVHKLGELLRSCEGKEFGSLEANRAFARGLRRLLTRHGLRIECAQCGTPSIIECTRVGPNGQFRYVHRGASTRVHGGTAKLPSLSLTQAPKDGREAE